VSKSKGQNKQENLEEEIFEADEWDSDEFRWKEQSLKPGFKRPVIIHRAILGSVERFMAILTEHLGGKWPFWISPRQIIVVPISEKAQDYCESVRLYYHRLGYSVTVDTSSGQLSKKIRNA
jgi:threonyl-tRNA synthetase